MSQVIFHMSYSFTSVWLVLKGVGASVALLMASLLSLLNNKMLSKIICVLGLNYMHSRLVLYDV